jgi:hypothetical protein
MVWDGFQFWIEMDDQDFPLWASITLVWETRGSADWISVCLASLQYLYGPPKNRTVKSYKNSDHTYFFYLFGGCSIIIALS